MENVPYGKEWQLELKKMSFKDLHDMFKVERNGENKTDYILKIREQLVLRNS